MKFYLGQNEDYSLGDSLSYRSEELCQRNVCVCVCEPSAYLFFVKGVHAIMKRMSGDCKDLTRPTPMAEACC